MERETLKELESAQSRVARVLDVLCQAHHDAQMRQMADGKLPELRKLDFPNGFPKGSAMPPKELLASLYEDLGFALETLNDAHEALCTVLARIGGLETEWVALEDGTLAESKARWTEIEPGVRERHTRASP